MTTATTAPEHHTWLYLKLYPGHADLLDATLTDVVAPVVDRLAPRAERWFFLRYLDLAGPHIRLRLRLPHADADAFVLQRSSLIEQLSAVVARPGLAPPPGLPVIPVNAVRSRPEIRFDLYEPEYTKWGGPQYLAVAEHVFQETSATALRLIAGSDGGFVHRLALGRLVLTLLLDRLDLTATERDGFLRTHYAWWSGLKHATPTDGANRDTSLRAAFAQVRSDVLVRSAQLTDAALTSDLIDLLCTEMVAGIEKRIHQQPLYLAFHYLHLSLNRLGITPVEEALVSLLAAAS
ncbi:lantibiotic dehydratase C-terminal domain-containing protein [Kitasatospora sp. SUK 42]|uniref:lantibiotic dehydratase C-terminal domain-containing protein n=1 Tax=Kitasatospora sp. SUK 42 TaxID=1588882 RepID=UPI0018CAE994|nr:lantibiotic dehydratase C-terminal domain-containing protein [Kitasatospora sp. SUK 42]MBV2153703.1 hypothetical protein [Kitasatospora sp. SUK 42]